MPYSCAGKGSETQLHKCMSSKETPATDAQKEWFGAAQVELCKCLMSLSQRVLPLRNPSECSVRMSSLCLFSQQVPANSCLPQVLVQKWLFDHHSGFFSCLADRTETNWEESQSRDRGANALCYKGSVRACATVRLQCICTK